MKKNWKLLLLIILGSLLSAGSWWLGHSAGEDPDDGCQSPAPPPEDPATVQP